MVQKKVSPGTNAPVRPSSTTKKASTSVDAKVQLARRLASEWLNTGKDFDPDDYLRVICEVFQVLPEEVAGDRRYPSHVKPRHLWWACIRMYGNWSYPDISSFVKSDHAGIMRSIAKVPSELIIAIGAIVQERAAGGELTAEGKGSPLITGD